MNDNERAVIRSLNKIGVDTRYVSLYEDCIYINNLKFSRFSRKKEDEFNQLYPDINVIRSKLFQKICVRVSRTIKNQIKPRDKIYIRNEATAENILLHIVLEPYRRKYGITISNEYNDGKIRASPKYLDEFASEYINLMLSGKKITDNYEDNTIYPLTHISYMWISDWICSTDMNYVPLNRSADKNTDELLAFLEKHIPNVNESIKQSVTYLDENRTD